MSILEPQHVHPLRWRHAVDVSRETCARFFRDGRSPADAVRSCGLALPGATTWAQAVNMLAELHCASQDAQRVA